MGDMQHSFTPAFCRLNKYKYIYGIVLNYNVIIQLRDVLGYGILTQHTIHM